MDSLTPSPYAVGLFVLSAWACVRMVLDLMSLFGKGDARWARRDDLEELKRAVEKKNDDMWVELGKLREDTKQILRAVGRLEGK